MCRSGSELKTYFLYLPLYLYSPTWEGKFRNILKCFTILSFCLYSDKNRVKFQTLQKKITAES